ARVPREHVGRHRVSFTLVRAGGARTRISASGSGRFGAALRTHTMPLRRFATPLVALLIAACTSSSYREPARVGVPPGAAAPSAPPPASGKYYLDDGPGLN